MRLAGVGPSTEVLRFGKITPVADSTFGNKNALKHGRYTAEAIPLPKVLRVACRNPLQRPLRHFATPQPEDFPIERRPAPPRTCCALHVASRCNPIATLYHASMLRSIPPGSYPRASRFDGLRLLGCHPG
jgi:hypothetical protein